MGQLDNQPENSTSSNTKEIETLLSSMTQELRDIQQNIVVQLARDMARLQAEQSRLTADIQKLQNQQQQIQSRQMQGGPGRHTQQQWTKQLAQVMASQLQQELSERLKEIMVVPPPPSQSLTTVDPNIGMSSPQTVNLNENAYRLLASLDTTLNTTFKNLQQELSSYQSSLSQQLGRMHSLQQQGEVILETLVDRLIDQLQEEATNVQTTAEIVTNRRQGLPVGTAPNQGDRPQGSDPATQSDRIAAERAAMAEVRTAPPATPVASPPVESNVFLTGLILALLSSITISFQNIITRVILSPPSLFGLWEGQVLAPGAGNSLLILGMRMLFVVPLMGFILAPILYPNTWRDIKQLGNPEKRGSIWIVIGSGLFLFMSQFFIYIALGNIPTGVAITLFFIFPPVTAVLAWIMFGAKPSFIFALATVTIYLGCFLTVSGRLTGGAPDGNLGLGIGTAIASGLTFAGYVILTQLSARKLKLHPAPFSVINFSVILILAIPFVLLGSREGNLFSWNVLEENWQALWMGSVALAMTTLIGYALNNFAIPMIGAPLASVVAATGPGLTSLMALLFIGEGLGLNEWLGVLIVTLWVLGISVDNMNKQKKPAPAAPAPAKQGA
ncbi:DMT family transporter [Laspinema olomoucense]|uniref:EamA family transporter n=1 Tax=Laspinema olomoucense D3b TaxID=2953688 RepID=A0ABT2NI57_9CYAN|nr:MULTISPECIES: DMT family transporter [unclassified Laspinema]MCT7973907.1 EamA family transporter [Laspinema sp. D3d]MCT7981405.1 EamA family transporter [Laspinema sp. D3b]MCT7989716.1 EamA family transporter [Laspinema sp. D3a]